MSGSTCVITVVLNAFFADYRAQAKIFISENMKTILDLENKISRIFGIKDFHLISDKKFLPSREDIRLLENGDIVGVLPNESQPDLQLLPGRFYSTNYETLDYKDKKRHSLVDECPIKEKKCKKKRKETVSSSDEKLPLSCESEITKSFGKLLDKREKKKKKDKVKTNINNTPKPEHNEHLVSTSTPIANETDTCCDFYTESQKYIALNEGNKLLVKIENKKHKISNEHRKTYSEKPKNIQLENEIIESNPKEKVIAQSETYNVKRGSSSNNVVEYESVHPTTISDTHSNDIHKSLNEIKETKLKSENDFSLEMIVDNSINNSSNESEENIGNNLESNYIKKSSTYCSESERGKLKNLKHSTKIGAEKNIENKDDCIKVEKKGCSLYILPAKKKNSTSWSTLPLLKTTNHVKIEKVPITVSDIDLSKFEFRLSDAGAVPVPNKVEVISNNTQNISLVTTPKNETVRELITNDTSITLSDETLMNMSQCCSVSTEENSILEFSLSGWDKKKAKVIMNSESKADTDEQSIKEYHQNLNVCQSKISPDSPTNIKLSKNILPISSDEVADTKHLGNFNETVTSRDFVLKNWRQNILDKLNNSAQNSLKNPKETFDTTNKTFKMNKDEENKNQSFENSSKIMKLNSNSYKVKKRNLLNKLGVNYYVKLLNKIDWDVTKSFSDIAEESNSPSEKKEFATLEKHTESVKKVVERIDNFDVSSLSSTGNDFITKRKRKRKHKKKVRVATPVPMKRYGTLLPKKLPLVIGNPKVHIRFQNEENGSPNIKDEAETNNASMEVNQTNENVKILQNLSLDFSEQNEQNIPHNRSITTDITIKQNNSTDILPCNEMDPETSDQILGDCSIQCDNTVKMESSQHTSSESHSDNKKEASDKKLEENQYNSSKSEGECVKNKSGFQKIALDYTNQNLTLNDSKCILSSSCSDRKLSNTCKDETLEQAKAALLEKVLKSSNLSDTITSVDEIFVDSNNTSRDLSIVNITEDSVVFI